MTPGCHETNRKFYKKRLFNQEVIETNDNKQNMKLKNERGPARVNEQTSRACPSYIDISLISIIMIYWSIKGDGEINIYSLRPLIL